MRPTPPPPERTSLFRTGALLVVAVCAGAALAAPINLLAVLTTATLVVWVMLVPRLAVPALALMLLLQGFLVAIITPIDRDLAEVVQILDEIVLVAALIRVGWLALSGRPVVLGRRWAVYLALFVLAGAASSLTHWTGWRPALLGAALSLKFPAFLLMVLSVPWEPPDARRLLRGVRWSVPLFLMTGLIGLANPGLQATLLSGGEQLEDFSRGGLEPLVVPFVHPGIYGWIMAVGTLGFLVALIERRRLTAAAGAIGGTLGAILSLRRRPLVSLPVAVLAGLLNLKGRQRLWALGATAALGTGVVLVGRNYVEATIQDTIRSYLNPESQAVAARVTLAAGSYVLAKDAFPLGVGFGRFGGYASERYYSTVYDDLGLSGFYGFSREAPYYLSDTYWPHLLGETGVLGTVAMLLALLWLWARMRQVRARANDPMLRELGLFAAMVLAEGLVESIGGPVFEVSLQAFVIALPIGMALALDGRGLTADDRLHSRPAQQQQAD